MKTLCIASHKGGTGKTTTAVTLGHKLALDGARVLLIDCDAQGNLADFLGLQPLPTLFHLLVNRTPLERIVLPTGRPNLDIIPGNHRTAAIVPHLSEEPGRDYRLRRALAKAPYDWVILDTAPSLGLLQTLALAAADYLLVPTELAFASGLGVTQVLQTVTTLNEALDLNICLAGILPTKWDRRLTESKAQLVTLARRFPGKVWMPIPSDAKAAEVPAYGQTLWEYAPNSPALTGRDVPGFSIPVGGYIRAIERLQQEVGK